MPPLEQISGSTALGDNLIFSLRQVLSLISINPMLMAVFVSEISAHPDSSQFLTFGPADSLQDILLFNFVYGGDARNTFIT